MVKLNSFGVLEWQKTFGGTNEDDAYSIKLTADGGYIVAGNTYSNDGDVTGNHGNNDAWIIKTNASGSLQWQKCLGGSGSEDAYDIQPTPDGGYIVAATTDSHNGNVSENHGGDDYWIVKLNISGTLDWEKTYGGTGNEIAKSIALTADGGYIVAGATQSNDGNVTGYHGEDDCWTVKLNATGQLQWEKAIGGSSSDGACRILQTDDGGYVTAGTTFSNDGDISGNHSDFGDYWIGKLNASGLNVAAFEKSGLSIYPNPVMNVLQMTTPNESLITMVKIIDVKGNVVLQPTITLDSINVENLPQGSYILEARAGHYNFRAKFLKK